MKNNWLENISLNEVIVDLKNEIKKLKEEILLLEARNMRLAVLLNERSEEPFFPCTPIEAWCCDL